MVREKRPFIGFSFGDFDFYANGIYRVSSGGRYQIKTSPDVKITTNSTEGKDGLTMLSSYYQPKKFQVQIAFDNLNRQNIYDLQIALNNNEVKELRFDEYNDRYWNAKINGAFDLKYICFDSDQGDIYKGEGTINFIAYDPFAYSNDIYDTNTINDGDVPAHFIMNGSIPDNLTLVPWGDLTDINNPQIAISNTEMKGNNFIWNSKSGLLYKKEDKKPIKYTGNLLARIPVGVKPNSGVRYRKMYL